MKKVIIGTTASIVVFSLFGLYIYKSKDTHADEYISVYEEIENIEESHQIGNKRGPTGACHSPAKFDDKKIVEK